MGRKKVLGEDSYVITVRITKQQRETIDYLVEQDIIPDRSSLVRKAIDFYLGLKK